MSGGQKQRVMIAMALSCNPQLLIADEPTTALDVTIQAQILEILRKLRDERGMAIIFITHDLGVIAEIADDVLVMFRGEEVEYGPVLDIFARPQASVHEGPARLPAAARNEVPPAADGRRLHGNAHRATAKSASSKRRWTPRGSKHLENEGRGRLLHPKSELAAIGHPWEEASTRPTRKTVAEGTAAAVARRESAGVFPGPPRHPGPRRRPHQGGRRHQLQRLSRPNARPRRRIGCGKTTTGRAILRLIEPTGGRVVYNGTDVASIGSRELRESPQEMQIVFQDPYGSLNPRMTIESALTEPMVIQGIGTHEGRAARPGRRAAATKSTWSRATCAATRTSSPAASGSGSASPARWPPAPSSSSATNRSRRSTSPCRPRCSTCSRTCKTSAA